MVEIGISPVLFSIGPFSIRWYGLMIAVGVIAAVTVVAREAKRKGMDPDDIYSLAIYVVIAGLVGARLGHVIDRFDYYLANPAQIIAFQEGGLAIYGGIIGGVIAGVIYTRLRRLPLGKTADAVAVGLILGQAIGRIGCTINGDAWGAPTGAAWGLVYTNPDALIPPQLLGVATHPYPVYELVWDLIIFGTLWFFRTRVKREGLIFLIYASMYAVGRFFLTMVRQEDQVLWGLQQAQVIALIVLVVAVPWMIFLMRRTQVQVETEPGGDSLSAG